MRSFAISLCVLFVSAAPELVPALDSHEETSSELVASQTALEVVPRRRPPRYHRKKHWYKRLYDERRAAKKAAEKAAAKAAAEAAALVVTHVDLNRWLDKQIGGQKRVKDVLKSARGVMVEYSGPRVDCFQMKDGVLPTLRGAIKGQAEGILYAGKSNGGFRNGQSSSVGVFVDHTGFEGCYTTTCTFNSGFNPVYYINGIEAGFIHGDATNDMGGSYEAQHASIDLGSGVDVVGGRKGRKKGFVETGNGKEVTRKVGTPFTCNTSTYATNAQDCTITLYDGDFWNGALKMYGRGSYPTLWRDNIVSSIQVAGKGMIGLNCKAIIFEGPNFTGRSTELPRHSYSHRELNNLGFNNNISSMKVYI